MGKLTFDGFPFRNLVLQYESEHTCVVKTASVNCGEGPDPVFRKETGYLSFITVTIIT